MERLTKLYKDKYVANMDSVDIDKILQKLGEYEQATEDGLLLKLPCKEGTRAYEVVESCHALSCPKENCKKCGYYDPHIVPCNLSLLEIVENMNEFGKTIFFFEDDAKLKVEELKPSKNKRKKI